MWSLVLIFTSVLCLTDGAYKCLQCDETIQPTYCDTVTHCGEHERCFVDAQVSAAGSIRYKLGCRDALQCNKSHTVVKRNLSDLRQGAFVRHSYKRAGGLLICSECCAGDLCNSAGCGNSGYRTPSGPVCFNCAEQNTTDDCSKIALCGQDEVCMLHKTRNPVTKAEVYESKCEYEQKCNDELSKFKQMSSVLVGKRGKRDFLNVHGSCLMQCCKTTLCNSNCNNVSNSNFPVPTSPQHLPVTTKISMPSSVTQSIDPCLSNPCHRGTCSPYRNTYKCTCEYGVYGRDCDQVSIPGVAAAISTSSHTLTSTQNLPFPTTASPTPKPITLSTTALPTPKPIDGHWSVWMSWSPCSATCGYSTANRTRTCTNPSPANGGQPCANPTSTYQHKTCYLPSCPVDGHWSSWSHWSSCPVSCGSGTSHRSRTCNNPSPANGGHPCANPTSNRQTQSCSKPSCPGTNDCVDIKNTKYGAKSGVYRIQLWQSRTHINVYCDMSTAYGGWTVFQSRTDGRVNFYRNFQDYVHGFGNLVEEFWLGLEDLHTMLRKGPSELLIVLTTEYRTYYESFTQFGISAGPDYRLHVNMGTGTAGQTLSDDMLYSNGASFSTFDHDTDTDSNVNCAEQYRGAWWFKSCLKIQLNGQYDQKGMQYYNLPLGYIKTSKMMFRRK